MTEVASLPSRRLRRSRSLSVTRCRDAQWWAVLMGLFQTVSALHGRRHVCVYDLSGGPGATDFDAFSIDGLEPCPTYTAAIEAVDTILEMFP